jgi:uncharacterized membrane protein
MARLPINEIISSSMTMDVNPPVYYILAHLSLVLFNGWDVAIRFPALLFGILLIPAMYLLGSEYNKDSNDASRVRSGVILSGLTSILFPLVYYSQYARAYTLSLLCFVIALILYIRVYRGTDSLTEHAFWIMVAVNAWVHLFSLVPLGLMCLALIIRSPRKGLSYALIPALLCLPLLKLFITVGSSRTIAAGDFGYGPLMMVLITPGEFFGVLFLVVFLLAIGWVAWNQRDLDLNLSMIVLSTIFIGLILSTMTPFFPRYYLTVSLIILLFAAVFLLKLTSLDPHPEDLVLAAFIIAIFVALALQSGDFINYYTVQKYICP